MITYDLFSQLNDTNDPQWLGENTLLLPAFLTNYATQLKQHIEAITALAPFRHMRTPGGHLMSVAMTNCGPLGWITDRKGYRYSPTDPITALNWPPLPELFRTLACRAAQLAGFADFQPQACLINCYRIGSKLSLHQDKDEHNLQAPIVSFSLGLPATFLWGGLKRHDKTIKIPLLHGDVLVWGGVDRLRYHAIAPLKEGYHSLFHEQRINLTFRQISY